ncbi:hypothetical protein LSH36_390g00006 [Paralvinella palmiformis]|uniref:Glycine cleavage system H protein n=1 Tax=Paralvinella palmiformis TaxID=53620 RepID=A0AAD9JCQ5_9ANNE|nr:hypothetical protein LSH36_390g00006 [Paralvinella palmiformis]
MFDNARTVMKTKHGNSEEKQMVDGSISTAQEALGDIVYAELPEVGSEFSKFDECGTLESVKAATEVYTPVSGKVCEKNTDVESDPALVNKSPYEKGWLFKIELQDSNELDELMSEEDYQAFLKEQE